MLPGFYWFCWLRINWKNQSVLRQAFGPDWVKFNQFMVTVVEAKTVWILHRLHHHPMDAFLDEVPLRVPLAQLRFNYNAFAFLSHNRRDDRLSIESLKRPLLHSLHADSPAKNIVDRIGSLFDTSKSQRTNLFVLAKLWGQPRYREQQPKGWAIVKEVVSLDSRSGFV